MNTPSKSRSILGAALTLGALALVAAHPALAADDVFASGKEVIKASAGKGSTIEMAMLTSGLVGALVMGWMSRNWFVAAGGFAVGNILWSFAAPMVGLA
ncbi:hypothetical protein GCM10007938_42530 [Vibrio zhanjiangensis]|uniref:Pilin n=1 Tax=Vibrio zhanjiangensis TaxID=1046128 RepID=A0ABQ6F4J9_9VIBR|nr:type IV conjugative transfer system pilin TraA [Vibrio zhanjiangensis]GLT20468.1 hypothetical protein GCM10007938_42530 [Vibrio zhanjiangensis]